MLTQARLKELLSYCHKTGQFTRLNSMPRNKIKIGDIAGYKVSNHVRIKVDGKGYKAHRLVWLYVYGAFPDEVIDHINGNGYDNRLENLRHASRAENSQNIKAPSKNSTTGFLGVSYVTHLNKFKSQIKFDGKDFYLGVFNTPEEAHNAYLLKKRELHPFNTL